MTQVKIGWRPYVDPGLDADATTFIRAAGITDTTQSTAINTLVIQLKAYGIWTKMKAIYPFVGGSAASHKFNLKDPRDLDAAYRLVFNGGWTHTGTGALPNGTTGYADTKLVPSNVLTNNNTHLSYYSRTDKQGSQVEIGYVAANPYRLSMELSYNGMFSSDQYNYNTGRVSTTNSVTTGYYISSRTTSSIHKSYKSGIQLGTTNTGTSGDISLVSGPIYIGTANKLGGVLEWFSSKETTFASIGDGLTDVEATNFYNAVQTFQTTLGRNIGTGITAASDSNAITFIATAGITDTTQINAVNTLVTDLKAAGVWTKMRAIYPFVGGSATTHKWNLKDPRDANDAYRLTFSGGWTHSSTGALPNGTTGYADTKIIPNVNMIANINNMSMASYVRNTPKGALLGTDKQYRTVLSPNYAGTSGSTMYYPMNSTSTISRTPSPTTLGLYMNSRADNTTVKLFRNGSLYDSTTNVTDGLDTLSILISARNDVSPSYYSNSETAFSSIGDGLTDTEATAFYNAVQKYQTILGRHIGTPVLPSGQTAGLLDTYSGALVAYSLRKLRAWYYGAAIRVRRSSDNTEQDIYFDASGNLDTTSLLAFVGSGSGYVAKWYDQSGSTNHLMKTTAANQPRIVNAGVVEMVGGKPAVRWTLISNIENLLSMTTPLTNVQSVFLNITYLSGSTYVPLLGHSSFYDYHSNTLEYFNTTHASSYVYNGAKYINGVSKTNATFTKSTSNSLISMIHTSASGRVDQISSDRTVGVNMGEYRCFSGYYSEIVLYSSDQTTNRAAIESNINSYYSIY